MFVHAVLTFRECTYNEVIAKVKVMVYFGSDSINSISYTKL